MQNVVQNIDFSPIINNQLYESDKNSASKPPTQHLKKLLFFLPLIFTGIGIPIFVVIMIVVIRKSHVEVNERRKAISEFAQRNGFSYDKLKFGITKQSDKILSEGLDLPYSDVVRVEHFDVMKGTLLNCNFSYSVSIIFSKSKQNKSTREVQRPVVLFIIDLPVDLPRMFLDAKFNNLLGLEPNADNFISSETHQLEGDFPSHYSVKIEKNEHIDMYMTLTPEVMDTLKRNNKYDVWCNGKQLVLLTFGDYSRYFAGAPEVFKNAEVLMKEIDKVARYMRQTSYLSSQPQETTTSQRVLAQSFLHKRDDTV